MIEGERRLKQIGAAAAKAAVHRKFHWCRRPNGFSDLPLWGVVADNLGMPLYQVVAFVNRLEELGNAAANYSEIRGNLSRFKPEEFAKALGMTADDAARIYAALDDPSVGWIAYDHISDFYDRNPDREDEGAAERKRRQRLRDAIRRQLGKLSFQGKIEERERRAIEEVLGGSEAELRNLQAKLVQAEFSEKLSTTGHVTRDGRMSQRDIVTVTPEKIKVLDQAVVDNFGDGVPGKPAGFPNGALGKSEPEASSATLWIDSEGRKMLVEFLQIKPFLAETYIERWRRDLQDDEALAEIIRTAEKTGYIGARFHTIITEQWRRHVALKTHGAQLHLPPQAVTGMKRTGND